MRECKRVPTLGWPRVGLGEGVVVVIEGDTGMSTQTGVCSPGPDGRELYCAHEWCLFFY